MKIIILLISIITLIGCQFGNKRSNHNSYIDTIYYDNGTIKEIITYKDSLRDGPYRQYYSNGQIEIIGQYLYGKETGRFLYYDSLENLQAEYYLKLVYEDAPHKYWDETLDSIDTKNKVVVINCQVFYNLDGSIDSTNSYLFQYWGTDVISLGDSLTLGVYLAIPHFKKEKSEYIYRFSPAESDSVRVIWSDYRQLIYTY